MDLLFEESHAVKRNPVFVEREFRFLQREDKTEELESRLHNKIGASEKRRENVDTDAEHSDGRTQ